MLTLLFAGLLYAAAAVLVVGTAYRVAVYLRTPAPLKIPTTPAPTTRAGVGLRLVREVVLFESLFKATKWTWLFGWPFHAALALVLLGHLRYFSEPVWEVVALLQAPAKYAAFVMIGGIAGLWARRFLVDRIRYISAPSDHLMLALLAAIALSGMSMRYVAHTDIVALKGFTLGLLRLDPAPLPPDPLVLVHLGLVAALMAIFPFSKLLHAPGVFLSPTRYQVDDPRERRHVTPWASVPATERER